MSNANILKLKEYTKLNKMDYNNLYAKEDIAGSFEKETLTLTPLAIAVCTGSLETVNIILAIFPNIDIENGLTYEIQDKRLNIIKTITPLQIASGKGFHYIINVLINNGANLNCVDISE